MIAGENIFKKPPPPANSPHHKLGVWFIKGVEKKNKVNGHSAFFHIDIAGSYKQHAYFQISETIRKIA